MVLKIFHESQARAHAHTQPASEHKLPLAQLHTWADVKERVKLICFILEIIGEVTAWCIHTNTHTRTESKHVAQKHLAHTLTIQTVCTALIKLIVKQ